MKKVKTSRSGKAGATATPTTRLSPTVVGPLLIAAVGDHPLLGALRLAEALARRGRVDAHVLAVVPPLSPSLSALASLGADLEPRELDEFLRDKARIRTQRRVHQAVGLSSFFSTSAETGPISATIAAHARARSAAYVLVGLAPADTAARSTTAAAASQLAVEVAVPVLACTPDVDQLPDSALVVTDFGGASIRAARAALPLLADGASVTLAHVIPTLNAPSSEAPAMSAAKPATNVLRRLADDLGDVGNVTVQIATLEGAPLSVLAEWVPQFDLIALGTTSRAESEAEGQVTAAVFQYARGSVLIAPPAAGSLSPHRDSR
ncbi:MAG TPA: universal stress protein [Gemmatimonadales bacterium]